MKFCSGETPVSSAGFTATMSFIGTTTKHSTTIITPTASNAVTRNRLVHLITSGPPNAIKVPSTTHSVPNMGFHIVGSSVSPNAPNRLIMDDANKLAATAYHPKFARLITVDRMATPFLPSTDRSQIHKSIPYRTAKSTGRHSISTHTILKQKILIIICLKSKYCATYAPCV